jgi:hypothetical protein
MKEAFETIDRVLRGAGYQLDMAGQMGNFAPEQKDRYTVRKFKSRPIVGVDAVAVVRYEKVDGMRGQYDLFIQHGEKTMRVNPYANQYDAIKAEFGAASNVDADAVEDMAAKYNQLIKDLHEGMVDAQADGVDANPYDIVEGVLADEGWVITFLKNGGVIDVKGRIADDIYSGSQI